MPPAGLISDPSTPLLQERVKSVFRQLPKALAGDEEAVHQMRVAGRRLRVALPLLARKPEGKRVRRALRGLRQLTRTAGASRDLDVILGIFEERVRGAEAPSAELRLLRRRLRDARSRSRKRMAEALLDLEIARLRRDLRRIAGRRAEGVFLTLARVRQKRDEEGGGVLQALEAAGEAFDPDALHRIRIRCRRLRYTAEVADALRGQCSEAPAMFKDLQERLGQVHDAQVLAGWLGSQAAAAEAVGRTALAAEARRQEAVFVETARAHHRALLARAPAGVVQRGMEIMGGARSAA